MKMNRLASIVVAFICTFSLAGCEKHDDIASPSCVELKKTTDPKRRAELEKQCPRGGPGFRRSVGKEM